MLYQYLNPTCLNPGIYRQSLKKGNSFTISKTFDKQTFVATGRLPMVPSGLPLVSDRSAPLRGTWKVSSSIITVLDPNTKYLSWVATLPDRVPKAPSSSANLGTLGWQQKMEISYETSKGLSMQMKNIPDLLTNEISSKGDQNQIAGPLLFGSSTMASKKKGPKSSILQVSLRERFIQRLILDGKKSVATKIFDESLALLKDRIQEYNASNDNRGKSENLYSLATLTKDEIFIIALRKAQPWITTSSLRRGGKKVIIPEILTPAQQESIAIRWLILNSRNTSGKSMAECLASELFGCLTNQGKTINQREQLHKLAEANRAWAN